MVFSLSKWRRKSLAKEASGLGEVVAAIPEFQHQHVDDTVVPKTQSALLLHAIRTPYQVNKDHALPSVQDDHELLVKVSAVGLNPIDWKAP